ncbi:hypothetical protein ASPCAL10091 [Aspergillus calidoustus]|jgi:hypothetical protein|uniref:Uncharacterized protein n=1 Tax=Aspergillus calidoustus TaxID=454130 RepID=A0A0U5CBQ9_ASPCI|nr:hypothetical protein ASPCAL10091 [Aspergillus calidoustus]
MSTNIQVGDIANGFAVTPANTLRVARGKVYRVMNFRHVVTTRPAQDRECRGNLVTLEQFLSLENGTGFRLPNDQRVGLGFWIPSDDKLVRWAEGTVVEVKNETTVVLVQDEGREEVETPWEQRHPKTGMKPALGFR